MERQYPSAVCDHNPSSRWEDSKSIFHWVARESTTCHMKVTLRIEYVKISLHNLGVTTTPLKDIAIKISIGACLVFCFSSWVNDDLFTIEFYKAVKNIIKTSREYLRLNFYHYHYYSSKWLKYLTPI